jgi:hypothetical protein
MEQRALGGRHAGEPRAIGDAAIDVGATVDPHRVKEEWHGAGCLDGRRKQPGIEHAHATLHEVVGRESEGHAARFERGHGEKRAEASPP